MKSKVHCRRCGKSVEELLEYTSIAEIEETEVNDWVRMNDGMYDSDSDTVICTSCYIKSTMGR